MKQQLLVFRFSSLGDVAMTVPVIRLLLKQYPQLHVIMVSAEFVKPLFSDIERLDFLVADLKGKHKGIKGLYRLYKEIRDTYEIGAIADLHNVLRTKLLRGFFSFTGKPFVSIDKGRKEKKELTRRNHKLLRPLKSTFSRYADVFAELGYPVQLISEEGIKEPKKLKVLEDLKSQGQKLVGIAPFALHQEKTYPADKMLEVLRLLSTHENIQVYLFGGKNDADRLMEWSKNHPRIETIAGKMNFENELQFISSLDLMVSMDSANMHLASLYGVPVVSIWGGTHPYLGFYGWAQKESNAVQIELECRPSSVFGNKHCYNDMACMKGISPIMIYEKIMQQLEVKA